MSIIKQDYGELGSNGVTEVEYKTWSYTGGSLTLISGLTKKPKGIVFVLGSYGYLEEAFDGVDDNYGRENGTITTHRSFTFTDTSIEMSSSMSSGGITFYGYIFY